MFYVERCCNLSFLGSFRCDCPEGFDGDARSSGCVDYNECARSPCGRNAHCGNEVGTFRCYCPEGFVGDAMTECQGKMNFFKQVKLTHDGTLLNRHILIFNILISCKFTPHHKQKTNIATDIDECATNPCSEGAVCVNTLGNHNCTCPPGFSTLTSNGECFDINECSKNNNACATNAKCVNVPGSYKCLCPRGFEGQGDLYCNS
jgi:Calcium-binding EGF domain